MNRRKFTACLAGAGLSIAPAVGLMSAPSFRVVPVTGPMRHQDGNLVVDVRIRWLIDGREVSLEEFGSRLRREVLLAGSAAIDFCGDQIVVKVA